MQAGRVYWITGLSGAGKTTLGRLLYEHILVFRQNVVFLDGDHLREVFGNDLGHTREDRLKSAMRNARLCKVLSEQGIDVVCATISLFHSCQQWNRQNIQGYLEIFVNVPMEVLLTRDSKGLYAQALRGTSKDLVGIDIKEEFPVNPDITIFNDNSRSVQHAAEELFAKLAVL